MKIREAKKSDMAAIFNVDSMAAEEGRHRDRIREWIEAGQAFVALDKERVIGYTVLEYSFFSNGFISMLMVDRKSRRNGVATALVKFLEGACRTEKIFTSTNRSNKPMQELLKKLNYEPSGTVFNLDDGDPELFYFKRLRESNDQ